MWANHVFLLVRRIITADNISMLTDIEGRIAFMIHDLARLMRARFDAHARALGATRQQWRTLAAVARSPEPPTQAELADRLEVERITLCRMIDRLAEAGLVERRADPRDRRVWRIHLLPAAEPVIERVEAVAVRLEDELLSSLGADERAALRDGLARLREELRRPTGEDERSVA
jgi:DNA-binding MarR family transcriptional regulator